MASTAQSTPAPSTSSDRWDARTRVLCAIIHPSAADDGVSYPGFRYNGCDATRQQMTWIRQWAHVCVGKHSAQASTREWDADFDAVADYTRLTKTPDGLRYLDARRVHFVDTAARTGRSLALRMLVRAVVETLHPTDAKSAYLAKAGAEAEADGADLPPVCFVVASLHAADLAARTLVGIPGQPLEFRSRPRALLVRRNGTAAVRFYTHTEVLGSRALPTADGRSIVVVDDCTPEVEAYLTTAVFRGQYRCAVGARAGGKSNNQSRSQSKATLAASAKSKPSDDDDDMGSYYADDDADSSLTMLTEGDVDALAAAYTKIQAEMQRRRTYMLLL